MNIKAYGSIKSLDDDLNLFDDNEWDFIYSLDDTSENFEYFNDMRDLESTDIKGMVLRLSLVICLVLVTSIMVVNKSGVFDFSDYNKVANINSEESKLVQNYIDGEDCSNEDLVIISDILNNYFDCLRSESDYSNMYYYCLSTSTFADTYNSFVNKIEYSYDTNDCYARALRKFGSLCSVGKINKVVVKDNVYYCYTDLQVPTSSDVNSYIRLYSYNILKYFNTKDINEKNIVKFILDISEDSPIPSSSNEYCIKFTKSTTGDIKLYDDSEITKICISLYTDSIISITNILKGSVIYK